MMIAVYTLATFGALMVLWCMFGALLLPAGGEDVCVVVRVSEKPGRTERQLRGLQWLLDMGLLRLRICLLDDDLTPQQRELAERWLRRFPGVTLRTASSLPELRMKEE